MSFFDVIAKVERSTEEKKMYWDIHKRNRKNTEIMPFEEKGYIRSATQAEWDGNLSLISMELESDDGIEIVLYTNQKKEYFADFTGKKVCLSGLTAEENGRPVLYVSSCYSIEDRESILDACKEIDEEEKRIFQKKIGEFAPPLQSDLAEKRVKVAERKITAEPGKIPATYVDIKEMDVLYDVLEPMIPVEFRTEYSNCKRMLKKQGSNSEKRNYMKVISNILGIDWLNQYYKEIDIEAAENRMKSCHIGHEVQLEELRTQLLTCNHTKKAPKTLSFVGRSCGCGSLAVALAKAIGRKYAEIDLSGRHINDTDALSGTSRIYENGRCGFIFEKIMEVGPYGLLIIKNIDTYDSGILDFITGLIEKKTYTDSFMEIPTDLSNLWVICTASSTRNLPMALRKATHEILFEKMTEAERIRAINEVILPGQCEIYGMACEREIPEDVCRILIYQLSHNENKKIEMNIEALVVKAVAEGKEEFPEMNKEILKKYFRYDENAEKLKKEYVTDLAALENKFYHLFELYPESVRERVGELLEDIRYGADPKMEAYAINALRYIVNPVNGNAPEYEFGQVEAALKKMRYGQDSLACQVDDALLAEKLSGSAKRMTVLGLWGPPGSGKTTAAEEIAKALSRNCIKISFGGAGGSYIIKGKNKMVPNAGPSLILAELARKCGTYMDVIVIDELDKGTAEAYEALHEFLDPEADTYFEEYPEVFIPKNNFLVILTFNDISKIPAPVLDRMRLIAVDGYTMSEKKMIAKAAVIKKFEKRMGLSNITMTSDALNLLVREYSVAPGIRDLEKDMEKLLIRMIKRDRKLKNLRITVADVREFLGSRRTLGLNDMGNKSAVPGQAIALAVSGNTGSCIAVQVVEDPYQRDWIEVSGLMKGSCLESLSDALSYARRSLKRELPKLHISFRDPAVQKDGASAGVTLYMAVMSCILKKKLEDCCFTGVIDVYGNVSAVGVSEKLTAAEREGLKRVFIPRDNYEQLKEDHMLERYKVEIIPVSHVSELTKRFFGLEVE